MAVKPFHSFVLFAAMRTGSNFLEQSLRAVPGIICHGEAFNPVFIAYPNQDTLLGMSMAERDARPKALLDRINAAPGLNGFRYFPDHDPRVLDDILNDTECAKIVLSRNPVDSYISLKIARETGQWMLNDARRQKSAIVRFDPAEFQAHLDQTQNFHLHVLRALQVSGQTAFYLDYDDISDSKVLTGLCGFLGVDAADVDATKSLVPQNPGAVSEKVSNPAEMTAALAASDHFNLSRTPNFEPRRGPSVPGFIAARAAPLLFMPIRSGPSAKVEAWLARLGAADQAGVTTGFTQASLRDWMRDHGAHRKFTVLRHPVARAHAAFVDVVLSGQRPDLNDQLARHYKIRLPSADSPDARVDLAAFKQFLRFIKLNLNGQTTIRVDSAWASQTAVMTGFAGLLTPDAVIREADMAEDLAYLCARIGVPFAPLDPTPVDLIGSLAAIYDEDIEALTQAAYPRDYVNFGFTRWQR